MIEAGWLVNWLVVWGVDGAAGPSKLSVAVRSPSLFPECHGVLLGGGFEPDREDTNFAFPFSE